MGGGGGGGGGGDGGIGGRGGSILYKAHINFLLIAKSTEPLCVRAQLVPAMRRCEDAKMRRCEDAKTRIIHACLCLYVCVFVHNPKSLPKSKPILS